jgi:beta-lactamase regulating signal transducer with metallopeptidase domain
MSVDSLSSVALVLVQFAGWEVVYSTVLFGLVFAIGHVVPQRYGGARYLLWGLVLLRLILPPGFSLPYSMGNLIGVGTPDLAFAPAGLDAGAGLVTLEGFGPGGVPDVSFPGWGWVVEPLSVALVLLWVVGFVCVGGLLATRRRTFRRIVRRASTVSDAALLNTVERWRRELGVSRTVRLLVSDSVRSPFTLGALSPAIVLPDDSVKTCPSALLDCAIAHEMAHIRRWDDVALQIQAVITALYFFHPVAWFAANRMRNEADRVCDGVVLARGGIAPSVYGRSLLAFLGSRDDPHGSWSASPAFAATVRHVRKRIESIMQSSHDTTRTFLPSVAVLVLGLFLLPMATGRAAPDSEQPDRLPSILRTDGQDLVLLNPLPGARVASPFGQRASVASGTSRQHTGVDLVALRGTPVRAAAGGTVEFAASGYAEQAVRGNVVVIDHGRGYKTYYGQLDSIGVNEGQRVAAGEQVGTVGSTGVSSGPHLHFEVWRRDTPVNPDDFVDEWKSER